MRQIFHIDMDAFFASVELRRHPALAGQPLVIGGCGDPSARGVVATASYEARAFGIHSGMPLRTAYVLCPQAVFLPVDYPAYAQASAVVKRILRGFTPVLEDVGIDEAYVDLSASTRPPEEAAREIKQRIRAATGLTCSIGIAPNKLLAKIASDLEKPDGLTVIAATDVPRRIWPLPVRAIPGVGPVTEARLHRLGIGVIGQLAAAGRERLVAVFGASHGASLHRAAQGVDERPLVTRRTPKSRSREVTFQRDIHDWQAIARVLAGLCKKVAQDMQRDGCRGRTVAVKVRFNDFETHTREKTLSGATDAPERIRQAAFACLGRFSLEKPVRLVGVRLSGLEKAGGPAA